MKRPAHHPGLFLLSAALLLLLPVSADAQRQGPRGPAAPADPVAAALERGEALGLSSDQVAALQGFRTEAEARTAAARALLEARRAEMPTPGQRPRPERRQERIAPDPELRDAMRLLQQERQAARELLNTTLTVDQMRRLQADLVTLRAPLRSPAFRAGFQAGVRSAQRPGLSRMPGWDLRRPRLERR
jgi:hypothetical protein